MTPKRTKWAVPYLLHKYECENPSEYKRLKFDTALTPYLIGTPFNAFANNTHPDQAALKRAALSGSSVCLWKYEISSGSYK